MPASVYKICSCKNPLKCRHPWWFSFKRRGSPLRIRKSLDVVLERHVDSKTAAETEAGKLRAAIVAVLDDPASDALSAHGRLLLGLPPPPPAATLKSLTVGRLLEIYKERHLANTATLEKRSYEIGAITRTVLPRPDGSAVKLGDWLVADLTADGLERLREASSVRTVHKMSATRTNVVGGPVAANRHLRLLRAAFNWAIDKDLVERSPFRKGDKTTVKLTRERARSRRLQGDEAERLLAACGEHLRALVEAALETGCRRGELLSMQWHQVQFAPRGEIWLPEGKTKTGRGRRVPISSRLRSVLDMRQAALRTAQELADDEPTPGTSYVFGNAIGQRHGAIKTAWRFACTKAGIEDLHFHDLRREAGSRWMEAGVSLATIQKWLGHTNISQTSTYLATTATGEHEAMRRFEERMGRLTPIDTEGGTRPLDRVQSAGTPTGNPQQNTVRH
ncbi:MAG: tyrosine-type recombinase/integrase [Vicinamibacterales bacterium]